MGQKTNPIGARLGIIRGWESNWYGSKKDYATKLIEDNKIRTYLNARINKGGIAKIVIERTLNKLIVTIHTSKPGISRTLAFILLLPVLHRRPQQLMQRSGRMLRMMLQQCQGLLHMHTADLIGQ